MLDRVQKAFYELVFENEFIKRKGDSFQDFFSSIMELKYPGDFLKTRPWGKVGDRKNDGYVKSSRTLYQVYAPNDMSAKAAIAKIDEDFNGALPYWEEHFDNWIFVHNSRDGLGPEVTKKLLDLGAKHTHIAVSTATYAELREIVFSLSSDAIATLLGPAPSNADFNHVGFEKIELVLREIAKKLPAEDGAIRPVPQSKLKFNQLSSNVDTLIRAGMRKSDSVAQFFNQWHEPTLGDQVAATFKEEYRKLKSAGLSPDNIFSELQSFAGGRKRGDADHEASVLSVLAHLFEECDIFENPEDAQ